MSCSFIMFQKSGTMIRGVLFSLVSRSGFKLAHPTWLHWHTIRLDLNSVEYGFGVWLFAFPNSTHHIGTYSFKLGVIHIRLSMLLAGFGMTPVRDWLQSTGRACDLPPSRELEVKTVTNQ